MAHVFLQSKIDRSLNMVTDISDLSLETRTVQRDDDTLIIYLSSASGCNLSCRFCWLTQQGETNTQYVNASGYIKQAADILEHHATVLKTDFSTITKVHFNFMAKGDAFSNPNFVDDFDLIKEELKNVAQEHIPGSKVLFKISTIFPVDTKTTEFSDALTHRWIESLIGQDGDVEIYYSLYSLNERFRKKWLPKALSPESVGRLFAGMDFGLRLHYALIAGENDSEEDIALVHDWLERWDIKAGFNIVRYNPYPGTPHVESSENKIAEFSNLIQLSHRIENFQVVGKVGFDVYASCGMFVEKT